MDNNQKWYYIMMGIVILIAFIVSIPFICAFL